MDAQSTTRPDLSRTRQQLLETWEQETATTLKLLHAYPAEHAELRPHPRLKTARELAWVFVVEQVIAAAALRDALDLSRAFPAAPAALPEVVAGFERSRQELLDGLRAASDARLAGTTRFFTGPKQMGDVPMTRFLWLMLYDQIHHRGQFSVYLRMSGGRVPSIYGPTADEPWR
ncbi:MAG: DinB family protein [Gemmatimonadetes bacterium]|nr:DinB family protein [Gemmatimonadota bacterium]